MPKRAVTSRNTHFHHPLQSEAWAAFRRAMGVDVETDHGLTVTFHSIPFTPWTAGYCPKGPLPDDRLLTRLRAVGVKHRAVFIQLEPDVLAGGKPLPSVLRPAHHPLFTKYSFILDLTKSEEELLSAMHSKTRYNIKVATKHGVIIREDNSPEAFDTYLALVRETTGRQGFYAHNDTYHRTMWETMRTAGVARLFTATHEGETLASWIIFTHGDTIFYPYGASSRNKREVMAPTLLLWEIARWGKKNGYRAFDLWGAMGENPDPHDPWYGFHRFKQGFGPNHVEYVGSYDLVLNPLGYFLFTVADRVRWWYLHLRSGA